MASVEPFSFFTLVEESILLLPKNGKLMSILALSSFALCSSFFFLSKYFLHSAIKHVYFTITKFLSPDFIFPTENSAMFDKLTEYMPLIRTDEIMLFLGNSVLTFFLGIAAILIFATSYTNKVLSLKSLLSMIGKTCGRTMVTTVYLSGLLIGCFFGVWALSAALFILFPGPIATVVSFAIGLPACLLSLYLFVTWIMAIIMSVVEENCYGIHALRRAAALVENNRMEGFMLNLFYIFFTLIFPLGFRILFGHLGMANPMVCDVLLVNLSFLLKIWLLVSYTAFYFNCKIFCGENIVVHGSV